MSPESIVTEDQVARRSSSVLALFSVMSLRQGHFRMVQKTKCVLRAERHESAELPGGTTNRDFLGFNQSKASKIH